MLSNLFAQLLNLAYKKSADADLSELEGRSFVVSIDEFPQDIAIWVQDNKVSALSEDQIPDADVTISGNVKAILAMVRNTETGLDSDELYISGKINTAKRFQDFLAALEINWETFLAQFLPDEMASKGAATLIQGIDIAKGSAEQINQHLQNYLINEKGVFVSKTEFNELNRSISTINQRLDTLIATLADKKDLAATSNISDTSQLPTDD